MSTRAKSNLLDIMKRGETVRVMAVGPLASPKLLEAVGLSEALDGVWLDQEHCAIPHGQLELLLMACRAGGLDAFARVPPTDYGTIMRPMEAGASGVMVAMIRDAAHARHLVQWAKYPPIGGRGLFQANYEAGYGTVDAAVHVERANRDRWLAIQIEIPEAVDAVESIAAVEGVDWLFVGPGDLACTLGVPGQPLHPKCVAALEKVSAACRAVGKPWGTLARSAAHAAKCRELGCQLFSIVGDMDLVHRGLQATQKMYADLY